MQHEDFKRQAFFEKNTSAPMAVKRAEAKKTQKQDERVAQKRKKKETRRS